MLCSLEGIFQNVQNIRWGPGIVFSNVPMDYIDLLVSTKKNLNAISMCIFTDLTTESDTPFLHM